MMIIDDTANYFRIVFFPPSPTSKKKSNFHLLLLGVCLPQTFVIFSLLDEAETSSVVLYFCHSGRLMSNNNGLEMDTSAFPVDSSQHVGLWLSLQHGRRLLVVIFSHHPSPGGLPPLISMPSLVTSCFSRSEGTDLCWQWQSMT